MMKSCFNSLIKTALLAGVLMGWFMITGAVAQSLTHALDLGRNQCLKIRPEVTCDKKGVISVILHTATPAGYDPDELEVSSLTPGVSVQPALFSPVPSNPVFILNGANIGQEITLMSNAAQIGAGDISGSDLCCTGLVTFRVPRDVCQQPDPDLEIVKTRGKCRPWSNGTGHTCNFTVNVTNVGSGPYLGPLTVTDTYTAPFATVSNPSPPWVCTNFPASQSFTCIHPVTTVLPGQTVSLDYSMGISGYRRGGQFQNCAELRPNATTRGQVAFAQTLLNDAGYGAGTVDGVAGARTRAAVRTCQIANGLPPTSDYRDFLDFINSQTTIDVFRRNNRDCIDVTLARNPNRPQPQPCPAGTTGTQPNCRPVIQRTCPAGTVGIYPNCKKPNTGGCPVGSTGTFPNCLGAPLTQCPRGTVTTRGNCVKTRVQTCPKGFIGNWPFCTKI